MFHLFCTFSFSCSTIFSIFSICMIRKFHWGIGNLSVRNSLSAWHVFVVCMYVYLPNQQTLSPMAPIHFKLCSLRSVLVECLQSQTNSTVDHSGQYDQNLLQSWRCLLGDWSNNRGKSAVFVGMKGGGLLHNRLLDLTALVHST